MSISWKKTLTKNVFSAEVNVSLVDWRLMVLFYKSIIESALTFSVIRGGTQKFPEANDSTGVGCIFSVLPLGNVCQQLGVSKYWDKYSTSQGEYFERG